MYCNFIAILKRYNNPKNNKIMVNNPEITHSENTSLGDLTENLINILNHAHELSFALTKERARHKLSTMRSSNVSREINDLIKVIKSIKNY